MFSKACEYAIRATLFIALKSVHMQRVSLKEIAKSINSPEAFTAKILQQLVKANIINSVKGPSGGFEIPVPKMATIKLSNIVDEFDGDDMINGCGLGLQECTEKFPCPLHYKFKKIREALKYMLDNSTVYEMSLELNDGTSFLKI